MATPQRGVPLPERTTPYVRVLYAKVDTSVSFLCYSPQVVGHMMHWGEKQSFPCVRDYTTCPYCGDGLRKLWYGWLVGSDLLKRGKALLQLTETAVRNNVYLSNPNEDLRGAKIELVRVTDGKGSYVKAVVSKGYCTRAVPPESPNVTQHLFDFYKLTPFLARSAFKADEGES